MRELRRIVGEVGKVWKDQFRGTLATQPRRFHTASKGQTDEWQDV